MGVGPIRLAPFDGLSVDFAIRVSLLRFFAIPTLTPNTRPPEFQAGGSENRDRAWLAARTPLHSVWMSAGVT